MSPAIRHLLAERNLDASAIKGTGVGGRLTREEWKNVWQSPGKESAPAAADPAARPALATRSEKRVPMTRLRKRWQSVCWKRKTPPPC
ncbi:E3 binding domain-containing protein [Escherichia coli]